jgi:hypothetical protein
MPHDLFLTHGESWKRTSGFSPNINRPMHGQLGRGRFLTYCIAERVEWRTVSADVDDTFTETVIHGIRATPNEFRFDGPRQSTGPTGGSFTSNESWWKKRPRTLRWTPWSGRSSSAAHALAVRTRLRPAWLSGTRRLLGPALRRKDRAQRVRHGQRALRSMRGPCLLRIRRQRHDAPVQQRDAQRHETEGRDAAPADRLVHRRLDQAGDAEPDEASEGRTPRCARWWPQPRTRLVPCDRARR